METAIWLSEAAAHTVTGRKVLGYLKQATRGAGTDLERVALKLATGAGKTAVMAMLIAWQTVNAVRRPGSKTFTRGFLVVTPGLTVKDRLRVLQPSDPDSYYASRELVPADMLYDVREASRHPTTRSGSCTSTVSFRIYFAWVDTYSWRLIIGCCEHGRSPCGPR